MAHAIRMTFDNTDAAQYLEVHREVINTIKPQGLLLHSAGEVDGRWEIFDIWESPAAFERFSQQLIPVVQQKGIAAQPRVTVSELYNVWTPDLNKLGMLSNDPMPVAVSV